MANPVVQSSNTQTGSATSSLVITKPTGLAEGDLMVAVLAMNDAGDNNRSFSTPAGWTLETNSATGIGTLLIRTAIFSKVADSGDAAASDFTFSISGAVDHASGVLARIDGQAAPAVNISESDEGNTGSAGSYSPVTALTPDTPTDSLLIFNIAGTDSDAGVDTISGYASSPSATWTELADIGIANGLQHGIAYADYDSNTEITSRSANYGSDTNMQASSMVVIRGIINGAGTAALLEISPTQHAPAASAGVDATVGHFSVAPVQHSVSGEGVKPTVWTETPKS